MNTNFAKNGKITQLEDMLKECLRETILLLRFECVFHVVREHPMLRSVLDYMEKALNCARETKANANLSNLHLCLGVALAEYSGEKKHEATLRHWTQSYLLGFECGEEDTARAAAGHAFNVYFSDIRTNRNAARELETLVKDVEKLVKSTSSSYYTPGLRLRLDSYYATLGRQEAAQKLLLNDMKNEIDLLVDEDPENDYRKYRMIADVLMHTEDDPNALSAWSLYGPSERRKGYNAKNIDEGEDAKSKTSEADGRAKDTNEAEMAERKATDANQEAQDPGENIGAKESQKGEETQDRYADAEMEGMKEYRETKYAEEYAEESAERSTQSEAPSPKPGSSSNGDDVDFYISCNGRCNKPLTWASSIWKCKVCDNVDFEDECLERLKKGTLTRIVCSPDHDWLYVPSWVDEYRATGMSRVRIGGELTNGQRSGDRIVSVEEWLDTIRKKWNIEKS